MKKSYEQYSAEDFLNDPKFVEWMEDNERSATFWQNLLEKYPAKREEFELAQKLYKLVASKEDEIIARDKEALWQKIKDEAYAHDGSAAPDQIASQPYPWRRILAYAAMFTLLVVAAVYFWPVDANSYQTASGEIKSFNLPDKSKVVLNAASLLTFEQSDSSRSLYLVGEVFFDVQKGKQFIVESNQGVVSVLGTSFNISDRDNYYEVVCRTGKVKVELKGDGTFILTKGEYVRKREDGSIETNVETDELIQTEAWTAWTKGEFFFHDTKLERVMAELERQFGVTIHMGEEMKQINGAFYFTNDDLGKALENVLWPLRLDYEKKGSDIYLKEQ